MTPGPFQHALANLAAVSVSGVNSYTVETMPEMLSRGQLPALLIIPGEPHDERLSTESGEGFQTVAFSNGPRTLTVAVTHLLLLAPVTAGVGSRAHMPMLIDHIDSYFVALGADITLGGALLRPARVRVEPGIYEHGDTAYHGCAFRHRWVLEIPAGV